VPPRRCNGARYRETVRSEIWNPSFNSSPWMRGAPPSRVFIRHRVNGVSHIACQDWSAEPFTSGPKTPVDPETFPMPLHDGVRLDDQQNIRPMPAIGGAGTAQMDPLSSPFQNDQLLAQGDDFKAQVVTRSKKAFQRREDSTDQPNHQSVIYQRLVRPRQLRPRTAFWRRTPPVLDDGCYACNKMTKEQAARIQRELAPGSGCVQNGEPFLTYGIWVLPLGYGGIALNVFLIDRSIASESDHERAMEEAIEKLREAIAMPDML
jgi:hypothetical protein